MMFIVAITVLAWIGLCIVFAGMIFFIYKLREIFVEFKALASALSPYVEEVEGAPHRDPEKSNSFTQKMIERGYTVLGRSKTRGGAEKADSTRVEINDRWEEGAEPRD